MRQLRTLCRPEAAYLLRSTTPPENAMTFLRTKLSILALGLAALAPAAAAERVNINTADAAAIAATLSGVGMKKAEAIVSYREANGRFDAAADLANVKGIGAATVARNADRIAVSSAGDDAGDAEAE